MMGKAGWRRGRFGAMVRFWGGKEDEFEDRREIKEAEELWSPPQLMIPDGSMVFSRVWERGIY